MMFAILAGSNLSYHKLSTQQLDDNEQTVNNKDTVDPITVGCFDVTS